MYSFASSFTICIVLKYMRNNIARLDEIHESISAMRYKLLRDINIRTAFLFLSAETVFQNPIGSLLTKPQVLQASINKFYVDPQNKQTVWFFINWQETLKHLYIKVVKRASDIRGKYCWLEIFLMSNTFFCVALNFLEKYKYYIIPCAFVN